MASSLLRYSERHNFLVSECNYILYRLPENDYILHDMGLRIVVKNKAYSRRNTLAGNKIIKIDGLSTDPIDFWDDKKLEVFYSKLSLIMMRLYELTLI
jgi:hypothetical protein